ncbi:hypothetical protein KSP40_PGU013910 [Platanthera guangdongensis]|uniref:Uncharacterized protein n=1 Tax=Platanthera guangdongensis TaxID=2320717 RepID=A0ABR2N5E9_9ASPA
MEGGEVADDLSPDSKIILRKARDILANNPKAIKKKSISFLLKKMFVCRTGFSSVPSLRNQMPESRLEKLRRTVLHKKMHQEGSEPMSSMKRYLEDKSICKTTGRMRVKR